MMHAIRGRMLSMDDRAHWSGPCIRLIAASDAAAATNNRHHPWITFVGACAVRSVAAYRYAELHESYMSRSLPNIHLDGSPAVSFAFSLLSPRM